MLKHFAFHSKNFAFHLKFCIVVSAVFWASASIGSLEKSKFDDTNLPLSEIEKRVKNVLERTVEKLDGSGPRHEFKKTTSEYDRMRPASEAVHAKKNSKTHVLARHSTHRAVNGELLNDPHIRKFGSSSEGHSGMEASSQETIANDIFDRVTRELSAAVNAVSEQKADPKILPTLLEQTNLLKELRASHTVPSIETLAEVEHASRLIESALQSQTSGDTMKTFEKASQSSLLRSSGSPKTAVSADIALKHEKDADTIYARISKLLSAARLAAKKQHPSLLPTIQEEAEALHKLEQLGPELPSESALSSLDRGTKLLHRAIAATAQRYLHSDSAKDSSTIVSHVPEPNRAEVHPKRVLSGETSQGIAAVVQESRKISSSRKRSIEERSDKTMPEAPSDELAHSTPLNRAIPELNARAQIAAKTHIEAPDAIPLPEGISPSNAVRRRQLRVHEAPKRLRFMVPAAVTEPPPTEYSAGPSSPKYQQLAAEVREARRLAATEDPGLIRPLGREQALLRQLFAPRRPPPAAADLSQLSAMISRLLVGLESVQPAGHGTELTEIAPDGRLSALDPNPAPSHHSSPLGFEGSARSSIPILRPMEASPSLSPLLNPVPRGLASTTLAKAGKTSPVSPSEPEVSAASKPAFQEMRGENEPVANAVKTVSAKAEMARKRVVTEAAHRAPAAKQALARDYKQTEVAKGRSAASGANKAAVAKTAKFSLTGNAAKAAASRAAMRIVPAVTMALAARPAQAPARRQQVLEGGSKTCWAPQPRAGEGQRCAAAGWGDGVAGGCAQSLELRRLPRGRGGDRSEAVEMAVDPAGPGADAPAGAFGIITARWDERDVTWQPPVTASETSADGGGAARVASAMAFDLGPDGLPSSNALVVNDCEGRDLDSIYLSDEAGGASGSPLASPSAAAAASPPVVASIADSAGHILFVLARNRSAEASPAASGELRFDIRVDDPPSAGPPLTRGAAVGEMRRVPGGQWTVETQAGGPDPRVAALAAALLEARWAVAPVLSPPVAAKPIAAKRPAVARRASVPPPHAGESAGATWAWGPSPAGWPMTTAQLVGVGLAAAAVVVAALAVVWLCCCLRGGKINSPADTPSARSLSSPTSVLTPLPAPGPGVRKEMRPRGGEGESAAEVGVGGAAAMPWSAPGAGREAAAAPPAVTSRSLGPFDLARLAAVAPGGGGAAAADDSALARWADTLPRDADPSPPPAAVRPDAAGWPAARRTASGGGDSRGDPGFSWRPELLHEPGPPPRGGPELAAAMGLPASLGEWAADYAEVLRGVHAATSAPGSARSSQAPSSARGAPT